VGECYLYPTRPRIGHPQHRISGSAVGAQIQIHGTLPGDNNHCSPVSRPELSRRHSRTEQCITGQTGTNLFQLLLDHRKARRRILRMRTYPSPSSAYDFERKQPEQFRNQCLVIRSWLTTIDDVGRWSMPPVDGIQFTSLSRAARRCPISIENRA